MKSWKLLMIVLMPYDLIRNNSFSSEIIPSFPVQDHHVMFIERGSLSFQIPGSQIKPLKLKHPAHRQHFTVGNTLFGDIYKVYMKQRLFGLLVMEQRIDSWRKQLRVIVISVKIAECFQDETCIAYLWKI